MNSLEYTRKGLVDNRKIYVFDNLIALEDIKSTTQWLKKSSFTRSESDRPDTHNYKTWARTIKPEEIKALPVYDKCYSILEKYFAIPGKKYGGYRVYCNVTLYGDMLFTHYDVDPQLDGYVTALWFLCEDWDLEWGGETLWFNGKGDAEFVVSPKPGRLVLFDGAILHCGRPPSRICFETRFTMAIKFKALDIKDADQKEKG